MTALCAILHSELWKHGFCYLICRGHRPTAGFCIAILLCSQAGWRVNICLSSSLTVFSFLQSGDIEIVNHKTRDTCQLKFSPYSYFSKDVPRKVNASTVMPGAVLMSYMTYLNLCDASTCWREMELTSQNSEVEVALHWSNFPCSCTNYSALKVGHIAASWCRFN